MAALLYKAIPASVTGYFNDELPLGPIAAEFIAGSEASAFLLNPETESFKGVMNGASIILGRRGSGKSALLYSLCDRGWLRRHLDDHYAGSSLLKGIGESLELKKNYFVTIRIEAPYEMAEVDKMLRQRNFPTLEAAADAWRKRILHNILLHFVNNEEARKSLPSPLRAEIRSIAAVVGASARSVLAMKGLIAAIRAAHKSRDHLLDHLGEALAASGMRALVLIDTMEEYRIREAAVSDVVSGLLYEISRHAGNGAIFEIKAALPTEIYRLVRDAGAPGRYALPTEFIHWTPTSLLQIAAHRAILMANTRSMAMFDRIVSFLPREKAGLDGPMANRVLAEFFGERVENEAGAAEEPVNVLLRHTMLLPRQLLNTMSFAFRAAMRESGSLQVGQKHLQEALSKGAEQVIAEVFAAYRHVYPDISATAPIFLRNCSASMTYGEMQKAYNHSVKGRYHHEYVDDFPSFLEAIVECGFVGVHGRETPRYVEGRFAYNATSIPNYTARDRFVLHPAAKRHYGIAPSALEGRVVLPLGSHVELD